MVGGAQQIRGETTDLPPSDLPAMEHVLSRRCPAPPRWIMTPSDDLVMITVAIQSVPLVM